MEQQFHKLWKLGAHLYANASSHQVSLRAGHKPKALQSLPDQNQLRNM